MMNFTDYQAEDTFQCSADAMFQHQFATVTQQGFHLADAHAQAAFVQVRTRRDAALSHCLDLRVGMLSSPHLISFSSQGCVP